MKSQRNINADIEKLENLISEKKYAEQLIFIQELDLYYCSKINCWDKEVKTTLSSWASVIGNYSEYDNNSRKALKLLKEYKESLNMCNIKNGSYSSATEIVSKIFTNFILASERFNHRNKEKFTIKNEYDVQDLMYSYLTLLFEDVVREEHTPSTAGGSNRIDFILKTEQLAIETKMTRTTMTASSLRNELLVDIGCYKAHPACKTIFFFIYDKNHLIEQYLNIKNDLENQYKNVKIFFAR